MRYDIVIVTYNSAQWLKGCVSALQASAQGCTDELNLIFVDNCSQDDTAARLEALKATHTFGSFSILCQTQNLGFSAGCNLGAAAGDAPLVFFLNADTEVSPGLFAQLNAAITAAADTVAAFECRQLPFETGHHINPVTLETSWATGAALVVRRQALEEIGGFDEHLFMYCEDVDLSWRLRAAGYTLQYVPTAEVVHYSYKEKTDGGAEQKLSEYAGSFLGNLLLRYKYGSLQDIWRGHLMYLGALRRPLHFANVRRVLAKNYLLHFVRLWPFLAWRRKHKKWFRAGAANFEGGFSADRGHYRLQKPSGNPLVSVVGLSSPTLPCAWQSLQNQTYMNHEAIPLENAGPPELLHALQQAKGEYIAFMGPGQYFYPDYLEMLVSAAEANKGRDWISAAYLAGDASHGPYALRLESIHTWDRDTAALPVQSVLLKRAAALKRLETALHADENAEPWHSLYAAVLEGPQKAPDIPRALSLQYLP